MGYKENAKAIGWGKNKCITWNLALPFVTDAIVPGFEPLPVLTPTPEERTTDWWRARCQFFDDYAYDSSPLLKKARLPSPSQPSVMVPDQLAKDVADPTTMPSSDNTTGHQSTGSRTNMEKTMDTLQKPLVMTRLTSLEERVDELLKARRPLCLKAEIPTTSDLFGPFDHVEDRVVGYKAEFGNLDTTDGSEFLSPHDAYVHGTHTSSIASEAIVEDTSFFELARGGAPSSHLPIYKVCWATGGCSSADILAAFYDSIHDGVDVISVSLGTSPPLPTYVDDPLSVGSFHAVARGIAVVSSCGNSGPYPQTQLRGLFLWLQAPLIEFSPPPLRDMCYCELHGRALGPDGMVSRGNAQDKL
ncbi:putative cucumisin [Helianthus annuus]|uniref:Cucumisin n=1 Tax=Helianthus annuus TaxID=4232 RepID=A0A9K3H3Q8_HELAN|nr:putative cucumisin [Helianthus annuus]KAJ0830451.1 putative cucumisin [Helianthus annuus]KAJ0843825.1 putative cucumisin [Helianthus annuus]